ncbi:ubiquinol oxidase subunit II [Buchnera aphidicola (Takecallis taiwana)]|uniref:ubiquinol oxidase subunit II n=1 Tax=Buchnera aphidicola TaxID=9 RepID=UPI0031B6DD5E
MNKRNIAKKLMFILGMFLFLGFHRTIVHPAGVTSIQQYKLMCIVCVAMLTLVIPVIFMTLFFVYKYRHCKMSIYTPTWSHSTKVELMVWFVPVMIVFFLGFLAWSTSHGLDPKKRIIAVNRPITINVVALDWNWLFIYPKENIATMNELVIPNNTPIHFNITSNSVMSAFFIPKLGSQIYAMPRMYGMLNLMAKFPGRYHGFSSNYNGPGFSKMKFNTIVVPNHYMFNKWVKRVQHISYKLNTINKFRIISRPTLLHPIKYFSCVYPNLFNIIIRRVLS